MTNPVLPGKKRQAITVPSRGERTVAKTAGRASAVAPTSAIRQKIRVRRSGKELLLYKLANAVLGPRSDEADDDRHGPEAGITAGMASWSTPNQFRYRGSAVSKAAVSTKLFRAAVGDTRSGSVVTTAREYKFVVDPGSYTRSPVAEYMWKSPRVWAAWPLAEAPQAPAEPPAAAPQLAPAPGGLQGARERGEAAKALMVSTGELVPVDKLAQAWDISPQALSQAEKAGRLFSIRLKGTRYYPQEILTLDRGAVAKVCQALQPLDPASMLIFWKRSHPSLDGLTVEQALSGENGMPQLARVEQLALATSAQARADAAEKS